MMRMWASMIAQTRQEWIRSPTSCKRLIYPSVNASLRRLIETMPPDYELHSYWENRFASENHFEWLGDGSDTILPHVRSYLIHSRDSGITSPLNAARLLHIGAGTSSLSERIREVYRDVYGVEVDEQAIVNTDFAGNLVAKKQAEETLLASNEPGSGKGMRWVCVDAMKWKDTEAALGGSGKLQSFDVVVDKSTSDAISCREDVSHSGADACLHPVFNEYFTKHGGRKIELPPVEVLAIHLASLVRPNGVWIALTFSSNRFAFLTSPLEPSALNTPHAANFWSVEKVVTVDAPTGMEGRGSAPVVQHYVFVLRRKRD